MTAHTAETKAKIAASHQGKRHSEDTRRKMSAAAKLRGAPVLSALSRERMADKLRGRKLSREHCEKISKALTGRKLAPGHHAKIFASRKGSKS